MDDNSPAVEMPKYRSHKTVHALQIADIDIHPDGSGTIKPEEEGYAPFKVDREYMQKHQPKVGGYYVVYADGYKSFSPKGAFQEGYTRI